MTIHLRCVQLPDDAPVLCDAPALRELDPAAALRRRFTATLRRRCRRLVRQALRCPRPLRRRRLRRSVVATGPGRALCAASSCRYHLAEFHREAPLWHGCAKLVAERGAGVGLTQVEVAAMVGMTRPNIGLIEAKALARLEADGIHRRRRETPIDQRLLASLQEGEASTVELAAVTGWSRGAVESALGRMLKAGTVAYRERSRREGRAWYAVATNDAAA